MITEYMLNQLRERMPGNPHQTEQPEDWDKLQRPYVWKVCSSNVETKLTGLFDHGYGCIALFDHGELIDVSSSGVCYGSDLVMLSPSTFGEHAGIYRKFSD